ncbi:hypothetical protein GYMLUDRAFT_84653 [Collybiopsis luxurians FD-317 M1]|uniref:F-box domain-containing protein n=1 Tax=Collybiopsis luxurians FD-317 M1 TaxID=944289 RepID=A0A0D0C1K4_9AGAR|nr:hypothetical protein GYMLUDRAFT_84653 [Collybiopsis luxurians FD-317 M1]
MHQALRIPEVLREILTRCDDHTNSSAVRVCKLWSDISLDVLWHDISLRPVVRLFGELQNVSKETWTYRATPTVKEWLRFEKHYQQRIHVLHCSSYKIAHSLEPALALLLRTKPPGPLLPSLHTIDWTGLAGLGMAELCVMFMHPKVQHFKIASHNDYEDRSHIYDSFQMVSFFEGISSRMPLLLTLEISIFPLPPHQFSIATIIRSLSNLTRISVPAFSDSTLLLEAILRSRIVQLRCPSGYLKTVHFSDTSGWSRALKTLEIRSSYDAAAHLFAAPLALTDVSIFSLGPASPHDLQNLISHIAGACPQIQKLELNFLHRTYEVVKSLQTCSPDITTFADIEPLLVCTGMKSFLLSTGRPLLMDDDDLQILACSWTRLEHLRLSPDPGNLKVDRPKRLTLLSLVHLAHGCPNLESLSLYLDATAQFVPESLPDAIPVGRFQVLHHLDIGFSPISNHARVAYILARILPSPSSLVSTQVRWQMVTLISPLILGAWGLEWESVRALLPVLLKLRREGDSKIEQQSNRIRVLENEISMLRKHIFDEKNQ